MIGIKEKEKKAYESLKGALSYTNKMQAPRLRKVIVSAGTGSMKERGRAEAVADKLGKITGQKAAARTAKKSIASFKIRRGDNVGYQITLRGERMRGFLDKLINVALPRTKDFRGLSDKGIDDMGNLTLGIREHTIFPETSNEDIKDIFGFAVTVVTSAKNKKEAKEFLKYLGFPFKRE